MFAKYMAIPTPVTLNANAYVLSSFPATKTGIVRARTNQDMFLMRLTPAVSGRSASNASAQSAGLRG